MMMHGWSGSMSAWDWIWVAAALAAVSAVAAVGIAFAARSLRRYDRAAAIEHATAVPEAENVLADRFARGEIGEDEYWQRVHTLRVADGR